MCYTSPCWKVIYLFPMKLTGIICVEITTARNACDMIFAVNLVQMIAFIIFEDEFTSLVVDTLVISRSFHLAFSEVVLDSMECEVENDKLSRIKSN